VAQSAYRSIPRATIIALLNALPASCINLELDTCGQDHRNEDEDTHVCDVMRGLLPRMQHVRIRTGAMCSTMAMGSDFTAPYLKYLVVNCGIVGGQQIQRCRLDDYTGNAKYPAGRGASGCSAE
jgi:hypothetical protein